LNARIVAHIRDSRGLEGGWGVMGEGGGSQQLIVGEGNTRFSGKQRN